MGKRTLGAWMAVPLVLIALAAGGAAWWVDSIEFCSNRMLDSILSPDGRWTALAYTRDCGATTRLSVNVSLLPPGAGPDGAGNVFTAYGDDVSLAWEDGASLLTIGHDPEGRVFRRETRHEDVALRYAPFNPQASPSSR